MSNINWGNLFNNFANGLNQGVQNFAMQRTNSLSTPSEANSLTQNNTSQTESLFNNTTQQLAQTTAELAQLNQQQTINMLKELLNMPKQFEQFIQQLVTTNSTSSAQIAFLLLSSTLNMSQLSSLLQNSSKEAMTKLYQLVAQYNQLGVGMKDSQLSEISKLISFVMASSTSDSQALKSTMLMYLPWLPLTDPDAFKLEIGSKQNEESGAFSDDNIVILISTENYGNVKIDIFKTGEDGIRIDFASAQVFPVKDFDTLIKELSKKYNININMNFTKKEALNKDKTKQSQTKISMHTSPGVNPFLLLVSNSVIKIVHEIDQKQNLIEARKEKLE